MKLKRILLPILILSLALLLIGCGDKTVYKTVKFDPNGGSSVQNVVVEEGSTVSKPTDPTYEGYTFLGWYLGETLWDFETGAVTADITLKAKWERITYTVSFNSDGGTAVDSQTIGMGDHASTPKEPSKDGCVFLGWFLGNEKWNFEKNTVGGNITLTAKWDKITYAVTFDSDGGNKVDSQTVAHGDSAEVPLSPTKQNNRFIGWYLGETLWDFENNKVSSDITLKAKWEADIVTHAVKFYSSENKLYDTRHVVNGDLLVPPTPPTTTEKKVFIGWYLGEEEFDFESTQITASIELVAKWRDLSLFTIHFDSNGGTTVVDKYVYEDEKISEPSVSKAGYTFAYWTYNGVKWDFDKSPTENMTLVAVWERNYDVELPTHPVP